MAGSWVSGGASHDERFDIIPDIDADIDRLTQTLSILGYVVNREIWALPEGPVAAVSRRPKQV